MSVTKKWSGVCPLIVRREPRDRYRKPPAEQARAAVPTDVEYWTTGPGRDRWLNSPTPHALLRSLLGEHMDDYDAGQMATRCVSNAYTSENGSDGG